MIWVERKGGKSETPLSERQGEGKREIWRFLSREKNIPQSKQKNQEVHIMLHNTIKWNRMGQSSLLTGELPKWGWFAW